MGTNNNLIIETDHLSKKYGKQTVVDSVDLTVQKGEAFGFLGPNGAGKTTTLLMLLGLTRPSGGWAKVCGLDPIRQPTGVKRLVGYLPENVGFYEDLNAGQSLEYVARLNGMPEHSSSDKIEELLDLVGLKKDASKRLAAFSRGMKQRLGIAEVLVKEPEILFLDEPTLGLDPDGAFRLIDLIGSLNRERGITVLLSSHNLYQVQKISHRVGIMIGGQLIAQGSIESLGQEKFGLEERAYSLEEIYMKFFEEA